MSVYLNQKLFILVLVLCFPCGLQSTNWYSEYWQKIFWKMWEKEPFSLGTYVKLETGDHLKNIRSFQLSEQLEFTVSKNFSLEFHYTYIHGRSIVPGSPWDWQHRLELEANPTFHLPCRTLLKTRNRLEIRKLQNEPKIQYRLRQMTMLVIPFENSGRLKSFSLYNELFYNITTHLFTQDRLCPCQLTFSLSQKVDLDLFFLIRLFMTKGIWHRSAVFGTQVIF